MARGKYEKRVLEAPKKPDFRNLQMVLRRERPARPTLFEFFLNGELDEKIAGVKFPKEDPVAGYRFRAAVFRNAGYDYATVSMPFGFKRAEQRRDKTLSLNEGCLVRNRAEFEQYPWPDPAGMSLEVLETSDKCLPEGMKWVVSGPCGVLENVVWLVGYDNLCYMIADDPDLARDVFDAVGSRLLAYYKLCLPFDSVGAIISNDDWGFKTQTMIAPQDMRRYVFPWHKKIVKAAHDHGKPVILHSCGQLAEVMSDIVGEIGFDGKHSYEDTICPVEQFYDKWSDRIAIMGGIDMDFVCRATPDNVYRRSKAMIEKAAAKGSFALGTGNSVPYYVPHENYFAMLAAAVDSRNA